MSFKTVSQIFETVRFYRLYIIKWEKNEIEHPHNSSKNLIMNWADVFGLLVCLSVMLLPFQRINNELLENSNVTKWQFFKFSPYTKVSSFDIVFLYAIEQTLQ
jgi:hypothetical protein